MGRRSVGLLDTQTLSVETWAVDQESARINYNALHTKPQHWVAQVVAVVQRNCRSQSGLIDDGSPAAS
jgi:hypothetical protein